MGSNIFTEFCQDLKKKLLKASFSGGIRAGRLLLCIGVFLGCHLKPAHYNGPQFIAKDFKEFIRIAGMTHVRTSLF